MRRNDERQRGQMIPLLAFAIVAILGIAALTVDVGYWRYQQRLEQSASDAGAIAGAIALYYPVTAGAPAPPEVVAAAQHATSENGFTDDGGVNALTVKVASPPSNNTPPNAQATPYAPNSAVEVIVMKEQPSFFGGIFGRKVQPVSTRSVAIRVPDRTPVCFAQLDPTSGIILNAGNIVAKDCAVALNGTVIVGRGIDAATITYHGTAPIGGTSHNGTGMTPTYSNTPIVDPCFKIPGCQYLQNTPIPPLGPSAIDATASFLISAPAPPGYAVVKNCCALGAKFNPGLYYVYGGITGAVSGTGVTLVNVDGPSSVSGNALGGASITAPSTFGPPDNAPTAGVAFYQPPSNSNPIVNNGSPATWNGLFYAPTAQFISHGKPDTFSSLIIGGYALTGNKTLTINPAMTPALGVSSAQLTTHVALAE